MSSILSFESEHSNVSISDRSFHFRYPCSSSTSCSPYSIILNRGSFKIELWGTQGGDGRYTNIVDLRPNSGGKGGYACGVLNIHSPTHFYLFIGGSGEDQINISKGAFGYGGFNGGGNGGVDLLDVGGVVDPPESSAGGGGSTDLRISTVDIQSRIIIAGGGGGSVSESSATSLGGSGGGLFGYTTSPYAFAGNQSCCSLFNGQDGVSRNNNYGSSGGGGGGYYGGTVVQESDLPAFLYIGGAGGSSYISGYPGCSLHDSGIEFSHSIIKSGSELFLDPNHGYEQGHSGNGAAVITLLPNIPLVCTHRHYIIPVIIGFFNSLCLLDPNLPMHL